MSVTDNAYIDRLGVHRWPKGVYVAVFDLEREPEVTREPFHVYDPHANPPHQMPELHIEFQIEPIFVVDGARESTSDLDDRINILYPSMIEGHRQAVKAALSLHPLDNLKSPEDGFAVTGKAGFSEHYRVNVRVPHEQTMGFIGAFLRKRYLAKKVY